MPLDKMVHGKLATGKKLPQKETILSLHYTVSAYITHFVSTYKIKYITVNITMSYSASARVYYEKARLKNLLSFQEPAERCSVC